MKELRKIAKDLRAMSKASGPVLYHGTSLQNAKQILSTMTLKASKSVHSSDPLVWCATSPEKAKRWAEVQYGELPTVVIQFTASREPQERGRGWTFVEDVRLVEAKLIEVPSQFRNASSAGFSKQPFDGDIQAGLEHVADILIGNLRVGDIPHKRYNKFYRHLTPKNKRKFFQIAETELRKLQTKAADNG